MSAALAQIGGQKLSPGFSPELSTAADFGGQKLSRLADRSQRRADAIEVERLRLGASVAELCAAAGLSARSYTRHVSAGGCRPAALVKLENGLAVLKRRGRVDDALLIRATYGGFVAALARDAGVEPADVHAQDPQLTATFSRTWRAIANLRQAAIYLTNTAIVVKQRRLADVLGLTPAAVCLALKSVEDRRDDPAFDALLDRIARDVMGAAFDRPPTGEPA